MFNLGFGELAVIFVILILAVGPDRLPTMMKGLGKTIRTVRQASRDIRATVGIDEMLREDVLAPPPRRPVPKAAVARPAAGSASLPVPVAAPPTENARPEDTAAPVVATESGPSAISPAGAAEPAPATSAPATPASPAAEAAPGDPALRKD